MATKTPHFVGLSAADKDAIIKKALEPATEAVEAAKANAVAVLDNRARIVAHAMTLPEFTGINGGTAQRHVETILQAYADAPVGVIGETKTVAADRDSSGRVHRLTVTLPTWQSVDPRKWAKDEAVVRLSGAKLDPKGIRFAEGRAMRILDKALGSYAQAMVSA